MGINESPTLRVLLATTSYPRDASDWRGRFIYDQAEAIARQGIALDLWAPPGKLPAGVVPALSGDDARWLSALQEAGGIAHLLRRKPVRGALAGWKLLQRLRASCRQTCPDLYHINWLQNALSLPNDGRPALVTVLGSDFRLLELPGMAHALRRQFHRRETVLSPNAEWMASRLETLFGRVARIKPIPFGVAPEWFSVSPRQSGHGQRWLMVSRITKAKLGSLLAWGPGLFSDGRRLRLLGPMQETIDLPGWIDNPGATSPEALREAEFPEASGLLTLSSHAEGRPQILIEAMAAGLPVIASRIPAHADLIRHRQTGWLVSSRDELAQALSEAELPAATGVGRAAQNFIRARIGTWDDCASRYVDTYRELLPESKR